LRDVAAGPPVAVSAFHVTDSPSTRIVSASSGGPLSIVVLGEHHLTTQPLPAAGAVSLGRSPACDVAIFERSISRRHAILRIADAITIEDLASANGTRVGGAAIDPHRPTPVNRGEIVELGETTILIQRRPSPATPVAAGGIIVEDAAMVELRQVIDRIAGGALSVLLLGETGVGKEVIAELVHRRSPRRHQPLLRLNCAAMTETLLESELFGHERGAFTGAVTTKLGLLETAGGGTVFLDEIGELSPAIQVKLLRVLEDRTVTRVGGLKPKAIDVRFVAATNRDLEREIARGRFRQDLYYRLAGITLAIPPLRERVGEIAPLARAFLAAACTGARRIPALDPVALDVLTRYAWPGNIRELRNVIERAALLCSTGVISVAHLPAAMIRATGAARREAADPDEPAPAATHALEALYPGDPERERIIATLELCRGNQTRAAQILGMSRRTLLHRLERYGLPRPRKHH